MFRQMVPSLLYLGERTTLQLLFRWSWFLLPLLAKGDVAHVLKLQSTRISLLLSYGDCFLCSEAERFGLEGALNTSQFQLLCPLHCSLCGWGYRPPLKICLFLDSTGKYFRLFSWPIYNLSCILLEWIWHDFTQSIMLLHSVVSVQMGLLDYILQNKVTVALFILLSFN